MTALLWVHWLPHEFKDKIFDFIRHEAHFLSVLDASVEKWDKDKVNYKIENNEKYTSLDIHKVDGKTVLFRISVAPPKYLHRKFFGHSHIRKNCVKLNLKCNSCKKNGHVDSDCNIARRLTSQLVTASVDEDNLIDEIDIDQNFTQANCRQTTEKKILSLCLIPTEYSQTAISILFS